jgi:hypothetical protein
MIRKLSVLLLTLGIVGTASVASADSRYDRSRSAVRAHRGNNHQRYDRRHDNRRYDRHDNRGYSRGRSHVHVRPRHVVRPVHRHSHARTYVRYSRPRFAPPALRFEVVSARPGYFWVSGRYNWLNDQYVWVPGHYEVQQPNRQWIEGRWEIQNGYYVWVDGYWQNAAPAYYGGY